MSEKPEGKATSRPVSDDPADGTWVEFDYEETGSFAIVTTVLPPEAAPKPNGEGPNSCTLNDQFARTVVLPAESAPKPNTTSRETTKRRTLDDMRRLGAPV
jgi:hypothetical protein